MTTSQKFTLQDFKETHTKEKAFLVLLLLHAYLLPLSRAFVSFASIIFVIMFLYLLKDRAFRKFLVEDPLVRYTLLFIGFYALSILWSDDKANAVTYARKFFYFFAVPVIAYLARKEWLYWIVSAFLLGMFTSEMIAYMAYLDIWNPRSVNPMNPSPFMNYSHYSVLLASTAMLLLYRVLNSSGKIRFFYLAFFITSSGNLFLVAGRSGQLAFFLVLAILALTHFRHPIKAAIFAVVAGTIVFALAYNLSTTFQNRLNHSFAELDSIVNSKNYETSVGVRLTQWMAGYQVFKDDPMFGAGAGNSKAHPDQLKGEITSMKRVESGGPIKGWRITMDGKKLFVGDSHYHNQYVQTLVQTGLVGLTLLALIYFYAFKVAGVRSEFFLVFLVFLIGGITETILHMQIPMALFALILALTALKLQKSKIKPI